MRVLQLVVISTVLCLAKCRPTTESTHAILKRLGFDPVQRPPVNHYSKRVAVVTNKARYHNDFYNSNSDSRMFVVKLPPHSPYYSQMKPEKFKNEAPSKTSTNFRTNGKPGQIYHWNIPVLRKSPIQEKKGIVRSATEDSKVYHIKILPNQAQTKYSRQEAHKKNKRKNKYEDRLDTNKPNKYHRNKLYRFSESIVGGANDSHVETETSNGRIQNITISERHGNYFHNFPKNSNYYNKKLSEKYVNEVSKVKNKNKGPNYYVPAIPKQNSFYKYFTGNGKPKSFYVIEKSKKPSRLHRLL